MHRKTITVTEEMDRFIQSRVASGAYGTDSEYLRDLIRKDLERNEAIQQVRTMIQEGLDSGESDRKLDDILAKANANHGDEAA